jgi:hypothetical protein
MTPEKSVVVSTTSCFAASRDSFSGDSDGTPESFATYGKQEVYPNCIETTPDRITSPVDVDLQEANRWNGDTPR